VSEGASLAAGWSDRESYTPAQAAHILRLTPTRVRQLLQSGELEGERDEAGHWSIPARVVHTRLERLRRDSLLEAVGYDPSSVREMVEELRDRVRSLERMLEQERVARTEERRRHDTLMAQLMQRIPELEPPAPPESPEPREEPGPYRVRPERAEPVEPVNPRREEPERVQPQRVEPERAHPRESPETVGDIPMGPTPPEASDGPHSAREQPFTDEHEPRRGLWRR
jgi:hypothetical protein